MSSWSRLVRYQLPTTSTADHDNNEQTSYIGEPVDDKLDIGKTLFDNKPIQVYRYSGTSILNPGQRLSQTIDEIYQVDSPISQQQVGTIRCIGLNYLKHAQEANLTVPTKPVLFLKPSTSLTSTAPKGKIIVPKHTVSTDSADYESELGIIISKDCKNVDQQDAMNYVLGYTATNDVSSRTAQFETSQWCNSKGFDTACPVGPVIVSKDSIPDYTKLTMKGIKNGKVLQQTGLDDLIFSIPEIVSFLSQGTTLKAGTLILTGTPHGIGLFYEPKETLKHGDVFTVEISHGIGSLINRVEFES
ncbi:hypothetical protein OIO90_004368 [Microbotryomycetes sp. JL221]|nr:hypothetical protein OIO90_004368 [Microbotryomycetes sp. JL221]